MAVAQRRHPVEAAALVARGGAVLVAAFATGATLTFVLRDRPLPLTLTIAGGIGLLAVLGLAVVSYDSAVVLGGLLMGVVLVEPAPPDVVFATVIAVALVTGRFRFDRIPLSIWALVGTFIALNLLSAIFAVDPMRAGRFFLITAYLAVFGLWLTSYADSPRRARLLMISVLAGGAASSVLGVTAVLVSIPGGERLQESGRAKALFEDPNVFGPFMVLLAVIVASEMLEPRLLRMRQAYKVVLFLVFAAGILFAYSRAAWLNAAVAFMTILFVYALRRRGGKKAFYLLLTLMTALALLAVALAVSGSFGFLEERARFQSYDVQRFGAQRTGIEVVARHPFGIGPGQFEDFVPISAHSLYVRTLTEQGILGLVVMLAIVIVTLGFATRSVVLGRDTYGIGSAPLLAAWAGLIVNSAFVDTLHWRHLWLVAGLIWAGAMRRQTGRRPVSTSSEVRPAPA
jgi:O-antigen ligase